MPLRIDLKPFERLIINGASIRNGDRRSSFVIETQCRFLRETELIYEGEADTPCKQLWLTLQVLHLSDEPQEVEAQFYAQASKILQAMPGAVAHLAAVQVPLAEGQTHKALKAIRGLVAYEAALLEHSTRRSSAA